MTVKPRSHPLLSKEDVGFAYPGYATPITVVYGRPILQKLVERRLLLTLLSRKKSDYTILNVGQNNLSP